MNPFLAELLERTDPVDEEGEVAALMWDGPETKGIVVPPLGTGRVEPLLVAIQLASGAGGGTFIQMQRVYMGSTARQPSEDPEAIEADIYRLWDKGDVAETWVIPLHRDDDGALHRGEPQELHDTKAVSSREQAIALEVKYQWERYGDPEAPPSDIVEIARKMAPLGFTIEIYQQRPDQPDQREEN